jgi:hypothetical protein
MTSKTRKKMGGGEPESLYAKGKPSRYVVVGGLRIFRSAMAPIRIRQMKKDL